MKNEIKKIVKRYAAKLRKENFPFLEIYLFGSYSKNIAREDSDIDIAVVSDKINLNGGKNRLRLWSMKRQVDIRIEPHGFTPKEFDNWNNPLVYEIRTTGIRIV